MTHPAAEMLLDWATFGCPTKTGKPWSRSGLEEAIARGPHQSALSPKAIKHFALEIREKFQTKQAQVVEWDSIKEKPTAKLRSHPLWQFHTNPRRIGPSLNFRSGYDSKMVASGK
jgi:hypothetical protein